MDEMTDREAFRTDVLASVVAQADEIVERSSPEEVAGYLIGFGLYLVEIGYSFALGPVFAAYDRLHGSSRNRDGGEGWHSLLVGLVALHRGRLSEARDQFERALTIGLSIDDLDLAANSAQNLGIVAWNVGDLEAAEDAFLRSTNLHQDAEAHAKVLVNLASIYLDLNDEVKFANALELLSASPAMTRRGADRSALLGLQGLSAVRQGRLQDAESLLRTATSMARRKGAVYHEIVALQNLGSVRVDLGRPGRGLRPLRRAIVLAEMIEDYRALESAQRTLATALVHASRQRDAIVVLRQAREAAEQRQDATAQARILADLGALYLIWRKPAEAIEHLKQALDVFVVGRDRSWGPKAALNLGLALARTGRFEESLQIVRSAGSQILGDPNELGGLLEDFGDLVRLEATPGCVSAYWAAAAEYSRQPIEALADTLAEIASKLVEARFLREAVAFYDEALRRHNPETGQIALYQILNDRGLAKVAAGDLGTGIEDLSQSLALARSAQDRVMQVLVLGNLSEMIRRRGDAQAALVLGRDALAMAREMESQNQISDAICAIGLAQFSLDDYRGSAASLAEALRISRKSSNPTTEAIALGGIAQIAFARSQYRRALTYYLKAVEIETSDPDPTHETETLGALAETAAKLRDQENFASYVQRLVDVTQKRKGPIETALVGLQRSGAAWLESGDVEQAGNAYATAILLGAAESTGLPTEEFQSLVIGSVLAPFFASSRYGRDPADLERVIRGQLRRQIGKSARPITDLFSIARKAAEEAEA
jgi:tetratricopeptide (TPR) repeat protein